MRSARTGSGRSASSTGGVNLNPENEQPMITTEAVEWLRTHGHPTMSRGALDQALRRARLARATGATGPHLLPEPVVIWGRNTWTVEQLRGWQPLGQGARTDKLGIRDDG